MNYLEEYTEQLLSINRGEKAKINVHFIVSEPLISFCYLVNKHIQKNNIGLINMGVESIVVPHISLFMGYVDHYQMLESVFEQVFNYSKTISPFIFDSTTMYFKGLNPHAPQFLFIDSLQTEFLMQQKQIVAEQLRDITYPLNWDMQKERPHVTVGCYKNITTPVLETINSYNIIPSCKISQIGVSICGKHGVCLGLLKVFDLQ